ncbi:MAG: transcriptional regulator [Rhodospirillaceae bacterium]|nr:transcriptional regulator [Rhodospirillaceae bacterium]
MKEKNAIDALSALSQETRLRIVRYLVSCGEDGAPAGEIASYVGIGASNASFHLSALDHSGVVSSERQSRKIIYRADFTLIGGLISFLLNDCCGNHPDIRACCLDCESGCC